MPDPCHSQCFLFFPDNFFLYSSINPCIRLTLLCAYAFTALILRFRSRQSAVPPARSHLHPAPAPSAHVLLPMDQTHFPVSPELLFFSNNVFTNSIESLNPAGIGAQTNIVPSGFSIFHPIDARPSHRQSRRLS